MGALSNKLTARSCAITKGGSQWPVLTTKSTKDTKSTKSKKLKSVITIFRSSCSFILLFFFVLFVPFVVKSCSPAEKLQVSVTQQCPYEPT